MIDPITHTIGLLKCVYRLNLVMGKNIYIPYDSGMLERKKEETISYN